MDQLQETSREEGWRGAGEPEGNDLFSLQASVGQVKAVPRAGFPVERVPKPCFRKEGAFSKFITALSSTKPFMEHA